MQIPDIFKAMNMRLQNRRTYAQALEAYNKATQQAKASECIQCGQCEGACPQSIPIIERLRQAAEMFE
jgi:predicted aldo/keto reductase-like oxidoreductase